MDPGLRAQYRGKKKVFMTHPLARHTGCVLSKKVDVPAGKKTTLRLVVANDDRGDWTLEVRLDGDRALRKKIGPETITDGWADIQLDLSDHAGQPVQIELINHADDWSFEVGYWAEIEVESK